MKSGVLTTPSTLGTAARHSPSTAASLVSVTYLEQKRTEVSTLRITTNHRSYRTYSLPRILPRPRCITRNLFQRGHTLRQFLIITFSPREQQTAPASKNYLAREPAPLIISSTIDVEFAVILPRRLHNLPQSQAQFYRQLKSRTAVPGPRHNHLNQRNMSSLLPCGIPTKPSPRHIRRTRVDWWWTSVFDVPPARDTSGVSAARRRLRQPRC